MRSEQEMDQSLLERNQRGFLMFWSQDLFTRKKEKEGRKEGRKGGKGWREGEERRGEGKRKRKEKRRRMEWNGMEWKGKEKGHP